MILGGYFRRISVFLITFVSVVFFLLAILYAFVLSYQTPEWVGWIVLPGSMAIGATLALLTATWIRTGIMLIGLWAGGMIGAILYQTFVYMISSEVWVLWTLITVFGLICAAIAIKLFKFIMIIGTSVVGAFLFIRGIAFYIGGYPNEFELHNEIVAGGLVNVPYTVYIYVAAMVVAAVLSALWKVKGLKILRRERNGSNKYFDINP